MPEEEFQTGRSFFAARRGGPVGVVAALEHGLGPLLARRRGPRRLTRRRCLRPPEGGTRLRALAYFGRSAGGLRPARVPASRSPAPAADPAAGLVGSGRAHGPPPLPPARLAVPPTNRRHSDLLRRQNVIFAASCTMRLSAAVRSWPKLVCGMSTVLATSKL